MGRFSKMCTYGIGLPFDHPIWRNLPPCTCGQAQASRDWRWWERPVRVDGKTITWSTTTNTITIQPKDAIR